MSNQCMTNLIVKVTHITLEQENLLVVTNDMVKVTGVYFKTATVSDTAAVVAEPVKI